MKKFAFLRKRIIRSKFLWALAIISILALILQYSFDHLLPKTTEIKLQDDTVEGSLTISTGEREITFSVPESLADRLKEKKNVLIREGKKYDEFKKRHRGELLEATGEITGEVKYDDHIKGHGRKAQCGDTVALTFDEVDLNRLLLKGNPDQQSPMVFPLGSNHPFKGFEQAFYGMQPLGVRDIAVPLAILYQDHQYMHKAAPGPVMVIRFKIHMVEEGEGCEEE